MKTTSKIKKIGNGYYVLIPTPIRNILLLTENDICELDIKKINIIQQQYKCNICEHKFILDNAEERYCPVCQSDDATTVEEMQNENN